MSRVHLTFDNGPDPAVTPGVLAALAERGIPASFFVLGKHLDTAEGMAQARAIRAAGHRLGNHSWSHETPLGEDGRPDAVERELGRTQDLLDAVESGPRWFRPFGGGGRLGPHLLSPEAVQWLVDRRATCVLWNVVPGDWLDADGWVEPALAQVSALDHAVVVLHDILPEAMVHLPRFLDALTAAGHTFTTELPADCMPVVEGVVQPGLERFVRG